LIAKNFYPQFSSKKPYKLTKIEIKELLAAFKHFNSKTGFMCDIDHSIESDLISKIKCPTLIIHSKNDNSVLFEHAEYAKKMIQNSVLIGLDNNWGHLFWIGNDADESIRKTIEFIQQ
jgi:pimeloyl-ACP methyl ester carboxylesterase